MVLLMEQVHAPACPRAADARAPQKGVHAWNRGAPVAAGYSAAYRVSGPYLSLGIALAPTLHPIMTFNTNAHIMHISSPHNHGLSTATATWLASGRPHPIPARRCLHAGYRTSCYAGSELIFTNDLYTRDGALVQVDVWGGPGLPPRFGQCRRCPAGTHSTNGRACIPCFVGFYSDEGARECTACPAGTYSVPTASLAYGVTASASAPGSGTLQPLFAGAASCTPCPRGYYQPSGSMCLPCRPGKTQLQCVGLPAAQSCQLQQIRAVAGLLHTSLRGRLPGRAHMEVAQAHVQAATHPAPAGQHAPLMDLWRSPQLLKPPRLGMEIWRCPFSIPNKSRHDR